MSGQYFITSSNMYAKVKSLQFSYELQIHNTSVVQRQHQTIAPHDIITICQNNQKKWSCFVIN